MTTETTLIRTDTGTHAVVRVIDPGEHVSAPYSRAVGHLDRWVRDSRRAVDEFSAWIEGQAAQAAAEMRAMCDELGLPHAPVVWAEMPERQPMALNPDTTSHVSGWVPAPKVDALVGIDPGWTGDLSTDDYIDRQRTDPVTAYMRADDPDDRPGRAAWVNVDGEPSVMPARIVPAGRVTITPRDNPLAQAYAEREARGWKPDPADYGIPAVEPDHGPIDRWLRRVDMRLRQSRFGRWLTERFTPVKEEQ